jgi:hypothetical protein
MDRNQRALARALAEALAGGLWKDAQVPDSLTFEARDWLKRALQGLRTQVRQSVVEDARTEAHQVEYLWTRTFFAHEIQAWDRLVDGVSTTLRFLSSLSESEDGEWVLDTLDTAWHMAPATGSCLAWHVTKTTHHASSGLALLSQCGYHAATENLAEHLVLPLIGVAHGCEAEWVCQKAVQLGIWSSDDQILWKASW